MEPRKFFIFLAAAAAFIPAMLVADGPDWRAQLAVGFATGLFLILLVRNSSVPGHHVVCAMVIATAGELVLSLGWGLYSYQWAAVPYFVPPGHGIFYALAVESSRQSFFRTRERAIVRFVLVAGSLAAILSLALMNDVWGLLWWALVVWMIAKSENALILSTCFLYTIGLEWMGTWIGNWRWEASVPFLGIPSGNPPSGVAVLYGLLDLLTVMAMTNPAVERWLINPWKPKSPTAARTMVVSETDSPLAAEG